MNVPGAIVIAAGLLAGAAIVSGSGLAQSRPPEAAKAPPSSPQPIGRFLLLAASGQEAWRIDTSTGDVHFCVYKNNRVVCDR
jgi:hypothetical protein